MGRNSYLLSFTVAALLVGAEWDCRGYMMREIEEADFFSSNQQWRVRVTPGIRFGFPKSLAKRTRAGEDTGPEGPLFFMYAEAELSRRTQSNVWVRVWRRPLYNHYAPMRVLVPDDGACVVTLGDVRDMPFLRPYSDNDVVVYGRRGGLLERVGLRSRFDLDFLQKMGAQFPVSGPTASPYPAVPWTWQVELNEARRELVLRHSVPAVGSSSAIAIPPENDAVYNTPKPGSLSEDERLYVALRSAEDLAAHQGELFKLLQSEDPGWRSQGVRFLRRLDPGEARFLLVKLAQEPEARKAEWACRGSQALTPPDRMEVLLRLFQHPDTNLRARVVLDTRSFSAPGMPEAMARLASDPSIDVRIAVARRYLTSGHRDSPAVVVPLLRKLAEDSSGGVRAIASAALARYER